MGKKRTGRRLGRPRSIVAIIHSYLVVIVIIAAFLLSIGALVVVGRFLLEFA